MLAISGSDGAKEEPILKTMKRNMMYPCTNFKTESWSQRWVENVYYFRIAHV